MTHGDIRQGVEAGVGDRVISASAVTFGHSHGAAIAVVHATSGHVRPGASALGQLDLDHLV